MPRSRKLRIKWFRLAAFFIAGYFLYLIIGQQSQLSVIETEHKAAQQRLEQAAQTNAALIEERNQLSTPAYIEKIAREELGLVKPGEIPYIPAAKN
ncbi:Cell division protein FtsL [bioreactor metagenome]|uniref:Cell division protein FtsL n=1 Tax=bioreactor metagenome TaxID=1076179 RepID=A0A644UDI8_9ZZZZ|nr:septum formation initiator family protein [Negativicutes bacterium]